MQKLLNSHKYMGLGILLIIIGAILLIFAFHTHHPVEHAETWYQKIAHFFQHLWDKISGHKKEAPHKHTTKFISLFIIGILFIIGGIASIYRDLKKT